MNLNELKPKTQRKGGKRVGRGGKRGTTSGHGTKGQKSRAGRGIKIGFRGGDNRLWQVFPKNRGASSKPGNKKPHRKHRFYQLRHGKVATINVGQLNKFLEGQTVAPKDLLDKGLINSLDAGVKVLGGGSLKKKISLEGMDVSKSARAQIEKIGAVVK